MSLYLWLYSILLIYWLEILNKMFPKDKNKIKNELPDAQFKISDSDLESYLILVRFLPNISLYANN
jgi:hypothetical protein